MKTAASEIIGSVVNSDCMPILKNLESNSFDLVITDPPYGMNYQSNRCKNGPRFEKISGDSTSFPVDALMEMMRIAKNAVIVFLRWDNLFEIPKPKSFIVWDKMSHGMGDLKGEFGRAWEGAAFYPQDGHEFYRRPIDLIRCPRVSPEKMVHPTEKPSALLHGLIEPLVGDTVLDPFCGSGTTLVGANMAGRKWAGIEMDENYARIARHRVENDCKQRSLF